VGSSPHLGIQGLGIMGGIEQLATATAALADLYRWLHAHPELSMAEHRTAATLAAALCAVPGVEVTTGVAGTGVVGVLDRGPGPVVAVRAELDGLAIREQTGLPYASTVMVTDPHGRTVPVMHACGHDMHLAWLVGAVKRLAQSTQWSGTLLVLGQPGEELAGGMLAMLDDGLLTRFPVPTIVLAQHVAPMPAGRIAYGRGPIGTIADCATIVLRGRGGHGSSPQTTLNPVLLGSHVAIKLQQIPGTEVAPTEPVVVTVGSIHSGTAANTIADTAVLEVSVRTRTEGAREVVRAAIERIVHGEALSAGSPEPEEITWGPSTPQVVSDPDATDHTMAAISAALGADRLMDLPQIDASEDIGLLGAAANAATVYWFVGGSEPDATRPARGAGMPDSLPGPHSPRFAPQIEPTLTTGVEAMYHGALASLGPARGDT
jgi:amidohydrolase